MLAHGFVRGTDRRLKASAIRPNNVRWRWVTLRKKIETNYGKNLWMKDKKSVYTDLESLDKLFTFDIITLKSYEIII